MAVLMWLMFGVHGRFHAEFDQASDSNSTVEVREAAFAWISFGQDRLKYNTCLMWLEIQNNRLG